MSPVRVIQLFFITNFGLPFFVSVNLTKLNQFQTRTKNGRSRRKNEEHEKQLNDSQPL